MTPRSAEDELAVLRHLTARIVDAPAERADWNSLFHRGGHVAVRATYFLLYRPDAEPCVETFAEEVAGELLRKLRCRTEQEVVEYQGRVRGRVLWPATLKSRYTGDYDPTRYVCREVRRRFDTPENQLLKFMLKTIRRCIEAVPEVITAGTAYRPADLEPGAQRIGETLQGIEAALTPLRKHARLREVTLPESIGPVHLRRAGASKTEEFATVAALYRRFEATVLSSSWDEVARCGRHVLPLPGRRGKDADPWIELAAAVIRHDGAPATPLRRPA